MEGNGPIQGVAKQAGVLVSGSDPVAVDATCCRLMGIDPFRVGYLRLAAGAEERLLERNIVQAGESVAAAATTFDLIPELRSFRLEKS
jgi:uncharacterized protein (DUF362 family)